MDSPASASASASALPPPCIIKALVVYRNYYFPALIRTINVYQYGEEDDETNEREYLFHQERNYEECFMMKIFTAHNFHLNHHYKGRKDGVWECIYVFNIDTDPCPDLDAIPSILSIERFAHQLSRNSKLQSIPSLFEDLEAIYHQSQALDNGELSEDPSLVSSKGKDDYTPVANDGPPSMEASDGDSGPGENLPACFPFDLNSSPPPDYDEEGIDLNRSDSLLKKKRMPASNNLGNLALEDIAKYFDIPIVEASRKLRVGLTLLKKKCREFGIPRWPHRKIKSLDLLIRSLQEEIQRQEMENKDEAMAMAERQKMIESERQNIGRKPCIDINMETKKVRQNIFKRRYKARVLESRC